MYIKMAYLDPQQSILRDQGFFVTRYMCICALNLQIYPPVPTQWIQDRYIGTTMYKINN